MSDEVTLSQRLRTPPLPATHAPVGYRSQKTGFHPVHSVGTATHTTYVSHTKTYAKKEHPPRTETGVDNWNSISRLLLRSDEQPTFGDLAIFKAKHQEEWRTYWFAFMAQT